MCYVVVVVVHSLTIVVLIMRASIVLPLISTTTMGPCILRLCIVCFKPHYSSPLIWIVVLALSDFGKKILDTQYSRTHCTEQQNKTTTCIFAKKS